MYLHKPYKAYSQKIIFSVILLVCLGFLALYSAAQGAFLIKQIIFSGIAFILVSLIFKVFPVDFFQRHYWFFYAINIVLLIALKVFGSTVLGAQRWIKIGFISIQPSEFAKVFLIIFLAAWLTKYPIKNFFDIGKALALISVPSFLVLIQPDLGTTLVYIAICFGMLFWAGASLVQLLIMISPGITAILSAIKPVIYSYKSNGLDFQITVPVLIFWIALIAVLFIYYQALQSPWITFGIFSLMGVNSLMLIFRSFFWGFLKDYQQKRLTIFIDPYTDPLGAGYHIIQSLYAIGSGGILGKGAKLGDLTQGQFVPEQHTDFIFSTIGEEYGFLGSVTVVALFIYLTINIIHVAEQIPSRFLSLVAIGAFSLFFFHIFVNIGMNLSVMPITGVPLPFMSYGGSAMMVNLFLITMIIKGIQEK